MRVLSSRCLSWCTLIAVGLAVTSTGCRSTRDSLATVPGMGWVGSQEEATFSSVANDNDKPALPPPSREAIPQVVTDGAKASSRSEPVPHQVPAPKTSYPDTGFPADFAPQNARDLGPDNLAGGGFGAGTEPAERSSTTSDTAAVGAAQRGFYGEQYPGAATESGSIGTADPLPPFGGYDAPSGAGSSETDSYASDSAWGDPAPRSDAAASEMAEPVSSRSPYDQIGEDLREDWRNSVDAVSGSAKQATQNVQEFVRGTGEELQQGAEAMRDGVRSQYEQLTQGDYAQPPLGPAETAGPGDLATDPYGDPDFGATPDAGQDPQEFGAAASLNPPVGGAAMGGYSEEPPAPRSRSNEPWRPGSTSDYPQSSLSPTSQSPGASGRALSVEPASYDSGAGTSAAGAPASGWSHSQRLAPTYR